MVKNNKTRFSYVLLQYIIWLRHFQGSKEGKKLTLLSGSRYFRGGPLLSEFCGKEGEMTLKLIPHSHQLNMFNLTRFRKMKTIKEKLQLGLLCRI